MSESSYIRMKILSKQKPKKAKPASPKNEISDAFMNELKEALVTDSRGYFNFSALQNFKQKHNL